MGFTDAPWSKPGGELDAGQYCAVCLIDMNEGRDKVKDKCRLPVRSKPGGAVNKNALRNAAGRIFQMKGVPADEKRKAARKLVRLMREAKMEPGETVLRLAGMR